MQFRFELPLNVRCPGDYLDTWLPAKVQLQYQAGKWTANCQDPPVLSVMCDSIEEALVAVAQDLQRVGPQAAEKAAGQ